MQRLRVGIRFTERRKDVTLAIKQTGRDTLWKNVPNQNLGGSGVLWSGNYWTKAESE